MATEMTVAASDIGQDAGAITAELMQSLRSTADEVVPWFLEQMPRGYFQDTDGESQLAHLRAIIAAKASGQPPKLTLRSADSRTWTMIRPNDKPGILAEMVHELPLDTPLRAAKIHTASDSTLVLDVFEFGERQPFDPTDERQTRKLEETIAFAKTSAPDWTEAQIRTHFSRCSAEYILTLTPLRLYHQWRLFTQLTGTDDTVVELEQEEDGKHSRIIVAVGNSRTRTMLERVAARLSQRCINIDRAYLDVVDDDENGQITILGFVVQSADGAPITSEDALWKRTRRDLLRIKWIDPEALRLAGSYVDLGLTKSEVIIALSSLVHQVLVKANPFAYARERLFRLAERYLQLTRRIAILFLDRFDIESPLDNIGFNSRVQNLRAEVASDVDPEDAREFLNRMIDAVEATLRTNVHLERRYALSIRIDPSLLSIAERDELPYGVFFVHGRGFNAFHVRFRDIARGGVRAVRPISADQFAREGERLYDEAYGLAYAQQLKNKDIPEGGAKAVILVEPGDSISRCFKAFGDALLDLITPEPVIHKQIIDRFGKQELLYLGPDENITPDMIEWIVDRAARRGYGLPNSFMSSKPGAGINHKQYGVTSEGITVFLDTALRAVGIDPTSQPFTVKITGGPDGDVAGNEIRILNREYGKNARIVGIADGSGSAEEADGLDIDELLRLVELSLPIASFDSSKLGPGGRVVPVDAPDGFALRNTLHNRIVADAFIPAGGRPRTIHAGNWRQYLTPDGTPSSRVIVEGANLFLTPEARKELSDLGALIFKDSSANKCGVICSSFEISASMVLSADEFLAIKSTFVPQVITRLRTLARLEAELLLREYRRNPQTHMADLSIKLSREIIRASDAIEASLASGDVANNPMVRDLAVQHLPAILIETAGARIWTDMPKAYLGWIAASTLAAGIVYREGLDFFENMPYAAIVETATRYFEQDRLTRTLKQEVLDSSLPHRERIAELLGRGGTRASLDDVAR
ncbi:MAG: NAD-glutamate dehydrogenase domain-containing protein [Phycisphaerales bacterium]